MGRRSEGTPDPNDGMNSSRGMRNVAPGRDIFTGVLGLDRDDASGSMLWISILKWAMVGILGRSLETGT